MTDSGGVYPWGEPALIRCPACRAFDALRAALEQSQVQSGGIPPNWKLVPVEPADSQIRAAQDTWWHACNCETYWDQIYAAMIAAAPQPPVVEQEPVAWIENIGGGVSYNPYHEAARKLPDGVRFDLYTRPQPRQPLTDEQIRDVAFDVDAAYGSVIEFARAIERAHGIGGEK